MPPLWTSFALAPYAALLAVMFAWLSLRVAMMRGKQRTHPETFDAAKFDRASRVQANFAEYVPFSLLLLWMVANVDAPLLCVNLLAILLVLGRIAHAYGLLVAEPRHQNYKYRMFAILSVVFFFVASAGLLLVQALRMMMLGGE